MKKFFFCRILFSAVIAFIFSFNTAAENFRVRKVLPLSLSQNDDTVRVISGISDAVFITLPEDMTFINGLEITFKIPEEIAVWRDSVAYIFYDNLSPSPYEDQADYYGEKIFLKTVPSKFSLTLNLPLADDFSIKDSPYALKVSPVPDYTKGIFLRFQQVMKGVPESLEAAQIEVTAKPILRNKGILSLSVIPEETPEKPYTVYIDEKAVNLSKQMLLDTGEHHLSISSDSYRDELRTFRITQGKTTSLEVTLRGSEPALKIVCPESAAVFLDNVQLSDFRNPFIVEAGEHTVKFSFGDYEVVRNVSVIKGHSYTVTLDISAAVTEDE